MLQIQNISKRYTTGELIQEALNGVSVSFRDNEFVAILGPSGSGKTTLLNVIGGLDQYDSGDLLINNISTKKYKDRDWDAYRNHSIGFVFQSYNLITHQSILANVELALTIGGISKRDRRQKAKDALAQVGLAEHIHKKPNQLSGGQMQRVAIARALVNDPDILLADEPTGALDSETSVQVMELIKEIAKTKLVIMVTHNGELAETYANRIVKLRDGQITDDTNPYNPPRKAAPQHQSFGKTSMSFFTSLALSFKNLLTKKGRTIMTAFAGSIGIIGISLILSLSNGVNTYIEDIQRDTMSSYPITIQERTLDLTSMMGGYDPTDMMNREITHDLTGVYANNMVLEMTNEMTTSLTENNLTAFKAYLDNPDSEINQYLGENGIVYSYDVPFHIYTRNQDGTLIDANYNAFSPENMAGGMSIGMMSDMQETMMGSMSSMMGNMPGSSAVLSEIFVEMPAGTDDQVVSSFTTDSYDLLYGTWPTAKDEAVVILDENNELPTTVLYALGMIPTEDYNAIMNGMETGDSFEINDYAFSYQDILNQVFYVTSAADFYVPSENGTFRYVGNDPSSIEGFMTEDNALHIVGVIRPLEDASSANLLGVVGYTSLLTDDLIDRANHSDVVNAQQNTPDVNVLSGLHFSPSDDETKIADAKAYIANLGISDKAALASNMMSSMGTLATGAQDMPAMDETSLVAMMDQQLANAPDSVFLMIYDAYIAQGSYQDNLQAFGFVSLDAPASISIYADSFEDKDAVADCITQYNENAGDGDQITYTDIVAMMTSSITTIINVISYVLVAFVAVSLVVSSIMIGIITFISVLERTKEIGILRAIGASKRDVANVFTAETFIIGLISGLLGIGLTYLLQLPINAVIHQVLDTTAVNAALPLSSAAVLIALSVGLTMIGGIIPSRKAAKKDPVEALRSE